MLMKITFSYIQNKSEVNTNSHHITILQYKWLTLQHLIDLKKKRFPVGFPLPPQFLKSIGRKLVMKNNSIFEETIYHCYSNTVIRIKENSISFIIFATCLAYNRTKPTKGITTILKWNICHCISNVKILMKKVLDESHKTCSWHVSFIRFSVLP